MLVLSRKVGERLQIGTDIQITIVKIDRNSVRIGIEAPRGVNIRREELCIPLEMAEELELVGAGKD